MSKVMIVAEMSANHNGSLKNAIDTIKAAKKPVLMLSRFRLTRLIH